MIISAIRVIFNQSESGYQIAMHGSLGSTVTDSESGDDVFGAARMAGRSWTDSRTDHQLVAKSNQFPSLHNASAIHK